LRFLSIVAKLALKAVIASSLLDFPPIIIFERPLTICPANMPKPTRLKEPEARRLNVTDLAMIGVFPAAIAKDCAVERRLAASLPTNNGILEPAPKPASENPSEKYDQVDRATCLSKSAFAA
jgi:hypothetical protein